MPKNFLMLMPGRTGSTYVIEKMSHHPMIHAAGEILDDFLNVPDENVRLEKQLARTKEFFGETYPSNTRWVGFKTKLYPEKWSPEALDRFYEMLADFGMDRVILLLRSNIVKQAISFCRANQLYAVNKTWNVYNDMQAVGVSDISVDDFREQLQIAKGQNESVIDFSKRFSCPTEILYYEDLLNDQQKFFDRVHEFMDVQKIETHSVTRKNSSDDLRQCIGNFDQLRAACDDPSLLPMFDEVQQPAMQPEEKPAARLLVAVMSSQSRRDAQQSVMETWAKSLTESVEVVTFEGGAEQTDQSENHIRLNCSDSQADSTEKALAFFKYAVEHLEFDYIFKCDDNTYVDVDRLLGSGFEKYQYYGNPPCGEEWTEGLFADRRAYFVSRKAVEVIASSEPMTQQQRAADCEQRERREGIMVGDTLRESGIGLVVNQFFSIVPEVWPRQNDHIITYPGIDPQSMKTIDAKRRSWLRKAVLGVLNKIHGN